MPEYLCRSCGRRFPAARSTGAPICTTCRLPTVAVGGGEGGGARVKVLDPLDAPRLAGPEEPRIIPAAKGREAARRPTSEARRDAHAAPPAPRGGMPLRFLIPLNLTLLLAVGLLPSALLYSRLQDLEGRLAASAAVEESRTAEDEDSISDRIRALEDAVRSRGPVSADMEAEEVAMLERAGRAILHIEQTRDVATGTQRYSARRAGSGFIYDSSGLALTNFHVIEGYNRLEAFLYNGEAVSVRVLGTDPATDIALLQISGLASVKGAETVTAIPLGTSADLANGQIVYALGSPKNLKFSAARGIVSNPRRYQPSLMLQASGLNTGLFNNWIQTDAAINRGNSGGPLLDLRGRAVGVVTRKMTEADNIGFAIPIDDVAEILPALRRDGYVRRSMTGVLFSEHRPAAGSEPGGAKVRVVLVGSPAAQAGLRAGDVIETIGDTPIAAPLEHDLPAALERLAATTPGEPVAVGVLRGGTRMVLTITPRLREEIDDKVTYVDLLGCWVAPIEPALRKHYGTTESAGIWVAGVESGARAAFAGVEAGDVILKAAGQDMAKVSELTKICQQVAERRADHLDVELRREGTNFGRKLQFQFVDDE